MSETNETSAEPNAAPELPLGMSITKRIVMVAYGKGEVAENRAVVIFGSPSRSIEVVDLDMGSQFDLAEVTGGSNNSEFRTMAFVAASIRRIEDLPIGASVITEKPMLRDVLRRLGPDGFVAAAAAIRSFAVPSEPDHKAAVGN